MQPKTHPNALQTRAGRMPGILGYYGRHPRLESQDRRHEAYVLLAPANEWCDEGCDTPDLMPGFCAIIYGSVPVICRPGRLP